jgi:hypothetical protein
VQQASATQKENHQGPEQVELLFDRERPEDDKVARMRLAFVGYRQVAEVAPERQRPMSVIDQCMVEQPHMRCDDAIQQQEAIVKREDAKQAARVEISEVAFPAFRIKKYARDEEAGEDEK